MYCKECGTKNDENASKCKECSKTLISSKKIKNYVIMGIIIITLIGTVYITNGGFGENLVDSYITFNNESIEKIDNYLDNEEYYSLYQNLDTITTENNEKFKQAVEAESITPEEKESVEIAKQKLDKKIELLNKDYYIEILKSIYEKGTIEEVKAYFDSDLINPEDYEEIAPILLEVFMSNGEYENANNILRNTLENFSKEKLDQSLQLKKDIMKKYPDKTLGWKYITLSRYDQISEFENGIAKVGTFIRNDDNGNPIYKWGLVNSHGKEILQPKYEEIGKFLEDKAAVKLDNKWGFINRDGIEVITPQYDELKDPLDSTFFVYAKRNPKDIYKGFYNGFAGVKKGSKWGFIDSTGNPLGPGIIYKSVQNFSEGSGVVRMGDHWGLLDESGRYIVKPGERYPNRQVLEVIRPIFEGLAGANWNGRTERGLVNSYGEIVKVFDKRNVDLVQDFREGLASVRKIKNGKAQWGFINTNGNITIPTQFDSVTVFIDSVAKVEKNNKYGLIDRSGNIILAVNYDNISEFKDGYAIVTNNGKKGVVNTKGEIIIPIGYQNVNLFENNITSFQNNGQWGIINTKNEILVEPIFQEMKSFSNGVAPAMYNDKWGYVDQNGYFLIDPQFDIANNFSDGVASVKKNEKTGIVKLDSIPSRVEGKVVNAQNQALSNVTVVIKRMGEDLPYNTTKTDEDGIFSSLIKEGSYIITLKNDDYLNVYSYLEIGENSEVFSSKLITTKKNEKEKISEAELYIADALTGNVISNVAIRFRKGYNNKSGEYVKDSNGDTLIVYTNNDGKAKFKLPEGGYTAETEYNEYTKNYINTIVSKDLDVEYFSSKKIPLTPILPDGKYRVTLEWGSTPNDLDAHMYGRANNKNFHVYYMRINEILNGVQLDKDDRQGNGFETITIENKYKGTYRYSVFNFSDHNNYSSRNLSTSNAKVRVYKGPRLIAEFDVPTNKDGLLWEVFEIKDNKFTPINKMTNHFNKSFFID